MLVLLGLCCWFRQRPIRRVQWGKLAIRRTPSALVSKMLPVSAVDLSEPDSSLPVLDRPKEPSPNAEHSLSKDESIHLDTSPNSTERDEISMGLPASLLLVGTLRCRDVAETPTASAPPSAPSSPAPSYSSEAAAMVLQGKMCDQAALEPYKLGGGKQVTAVYEYWSKKRSKLGKALIRRMQPPTPLSDQVRRKPSTSNLTPYTLTLYPTP